MNWSKLINYTLSFLTSFLSYICLWTISCYISLFSSLFFSVLLPSVSLALIFIVFLHLSSSSVSLSVLLSCPFFSLSHFSNCILPSLSFSVLLPSVSLTTLIYIVFLHLSTSVFISPLLYPFLFYSPALIFFLSLSHLLWSTDPSKVGSYLESLDVLLLAAAQSMLHYDRWLWRHS